MLFRSLQKGFISFALLIGSFGMATVEAQSPFGAPACSTGYGRYPQIQSYYGNSGYGQPGRFPPPRSNYGAIHYPFANFAPPNYPTPQAMSYGGYPAPALNFNQSFYPGERSNDSHSNHQKHHHDSNHPWHLGHYLFGN